MIYAPGHPEWIDGRSVLAHDQIADLTGAAVSASTTAAASGTTTFDAANAVDGLTYDYWQASAGGAQWLKIALTASAPVDFLGLAAHDLGSRAASVLFEGSLDDATWVTLLAAFTPPNDKPLLKLLPAVVSYRYYRVTFTPGNGVQKIGALMLGRATPMQRGVRVGHKPAPFARKVEFTTNHTESGNFVGRSILRVSNDIDIQLSSITDAWYREKFEPFALKAETKPWFFMWDKWRRPDEVFFGYATERPIPSNDKTTFMQVSLSARGFA